MNKILVGLGLLLVAAVLRAETQNPPLSCADDCGALVDAAKAQAAAPQAPSPAGTAKTESARLNACWRREGAVKIFEAIKNDESVSKYVTVTRIPFVFCVDSVVLRYRPYNTPLADLAGTIEPGSESKPLSVHEQSVFPIEPTADGGYSFSLNVYNGGLQVPYQTASEVYLHFKVDASGKIKPETLDLTGSAVYTPEPYAGQVREFLKFVRAN